MLRSVSEHMASVCSCPDLRSCIEVAVSPETLRMFPGPDKRSEASVDFRSRLARSNGIPKTAAQVPRKSSSVRVQRVCFRSWDSTLNFAGVIYFFVPEFGVFRPFSVSFFWNDSSIGIHSAHVEYDLGTWSPSFGDKRVLVLTNWIRGLQI